MAKTLTRKQELFCQLFVKYDDGPRAYKEAYPVAQKWKGTSVTAQVTKSLNNPVIASRIKELRDRLAVKLDISAERVLREYARIGFSDARNLLTEDGRLKPVSQWDRNASKAVQTIKAKTVVGDDGEPAEIIEVRMWPKTQALDALGKHLGLFEKDNRQKSMHTVILHDPGGDVEGGDA